MKKVLVNGVPCDDNQIHEPGALVEVLVNLENLQIFLPRKVIVHTNSQNLDIYGEYVELQIKENTCNLNLYSDYANITVEKNSSNVALFGDHSKISLLGNSCNLNVFGDFLKAQIEDCASSPRLFGNHHEVEVKKGSVTTYGESGTTVVHSGAEATHFGESHNNINLPTP